MTAPQAARWYLRAGAWIGIGTGPGALMTGGGLAAGRGPVETGVVFVLGAALIAALTVAQGLVGRSATPFPGALLLTLSVLAPSVSGLHSGALGLERLLGWPLPTGAIVAAAAAALGAARFHLQLLPFLAVLGAVVPPVVAVLLLSGRQGAGWHGWIAWAAGSGAALVGVAAGLGVSGLLGIVVAAGAMLALPVLSKEPV